MVGHTFNQLHFIGAPLAGGVLQDMERSHPLPLTQTGHADHGLHPMFEQKSLGVHRPLIQGRMVDNEGTSRLGISDISRRGVGGQRVDIAARCGAGRRPGGQQSCVVSRQINGIEPAVTNPQIFTQALHHRLLDGGGITQLAHGRIEVQ